MKQSFTRFIPALLFIAVLTAALLYVSNRYSGTTIILTERTATPGVGRVYWDSGSGFSDKNSKTFNVAASQDGSWRRQMVQLPAAGIKKLQIIPLAGDKPNFEIMQLSLLCDTIQYTWKDSGNCQQQLIGAGRSVAEACSGSYPRIQFNADFSITISDIPASGMEIPPLTRTVVSGCAFLYLFLSGLWLLRPTANTVQQDKALYYLGRAAWLGLGGYYLLQLYQLSRYAVDVPYLDEWCYFMQDALPEGLSWHWLLAFHNEHRILPTKLMAWINLKLFGLDFVKQQLANFLLYGALIATVAKLKQRILGDSFCLFPLFLFFLLSPLNYMNHVWGFQSQFHLVVIFALLAIYHAFEKQALLRNYTLFAASLLLAAYSFSAGVALAILLLVSQGLFFFREKSTALSISPRDFRQILALTAVIVAGLACWFSGYQRPAHHPPLVLPFSGAFWEYFLNEVSYGFGFTTMSTLAGIVCLALVTAPLAILWLKGEPAEKSGRWKITAAIAVVLAILAIISMGRSSLGMPKSSRYAEFSLLLIPFAAIAWHMACSPGKLRSGILTLFALFCGYTSAPHWSDLPYRQERVKRLQTLECVERYYNGSGDGSCEEGFAQPIGPYIDAARAVATKFTRQFTKLQ